MSLSLSLSLCPFFRPILYFHFCQILLSRTANTTSRFSTSVLSSSYRLLTHASCSHLCVGTPGTHLFLFFPTSVHGLCVCCALLSLVIALTRAPVWYPCRVHTHTHTPLRSHSGAMLALARSFLSCVTQYRNGIYARIHQRRYIYLSNTQHKKGLTKHTECRPTTDFTRLAKPFPSLSGAFHTVKHVVYTF